MKRECPINFTDSTREKSGRTPRSVGIPKWARREPSRVAVVLLIPWADPTRGGTPPVRPAHARDASGPRIEFGFDPSRFVRRERGRGTPRFAGLVDPA